MKLSALGFGASFGSQPREDSLKRSSLRSLTLPLYRSFRRPRPSASSLSFSVTSGSTLCSVAAPPSPSFTHHDHDHTQSPPFKSRSRPAVPPSFTASALESQLPRSFACPKSKQVDDRDLLAQGSLLKQKFHTTGQRYERRRRPPALSIVYSPPHSRVLSDGEDEGNRCSDSGSESSSSVSPSSSSSSQRSFTRRRCGKKGSNGTEEAADWTLALGVDVSDSWKVHGDVPWSNFTSGDPPSKEAMRQDKDRSHRRARDHRRSRRHSAIPGGGGGEIGAEVAVKKARRVSDWTLNLPRATPDSTAERAVTSPAATLSSCSLPLGHRAPLLAPSRVSVLSPAALGEALDSDSAESEMAHDEIGRGKHGRKFRIRTVTGLGDYHTRSKELRMGLSADGGQVDS